MVKKFIMKITSQEEYGLRILLRIARCHDDESMSIQALSVAEGLSPAYGQTYANTAPVRIYQ